MLFSHSLSAPLLTFFLVKKEHILGFIYVRQPYAYVWHMRQLELFCRCIMEASLRSLVAVWLRRKVPSFVRKFLHWTFLSPCSALISSCLWSFPYPDPCPRRWTVSGSLWTPQELHRRATGAEKQDLCASAFSPCSICQNLLNRFPNTWLWILWVP